MASLSDFLGFFRQPLTVGEPVPIGMDELGNPVFLDANTGRRISIAPPEAATPKASEGPYGIQPPSDYRLSMQMTPPQYRGNPMHSPTAVSLANAMVEGIGNPRRALAGEPVTYGDAWMTALDGYAPGVAGQAKGVGKAVSGAGDDLARFVDDDYGGARVWHGGPVGKLSEPERQAQEVARMIREGRASEVTDDMLAAFTPNDNMEFAELMERGLASSEGKALPLDVQSRIARAEEIGFDVDAYHATRASEGFANFKPGLRGSIYFSSSPSGATRGAVGQSLEYADQAPLASVKAVLPVRARSDDVSGLSVNRQAFDALPEVVSEKDIRGLSDQIRATGVEYWDDVYEGVPFGDEYRYYKKNPPEVSYQDIEPGRNVFGYRVGGFNEGSDLPSLQRAAEKGKSGFLVADEGGTSIVASPDMLIRSQFARFHPELRHLSHLSAGLGAMGLLPLAYSGNVNELEEYLNTSQ